MSKFCPDCGKSNEKAKELKWEKGKYDEALPDIEVKNIVLLCDNCGFGYNCMGTKKS